MNRLVLLGLILFLGSTRAVRDAAAEEAAAREDQFVNPIGEGADPWVIRDPNADRYLWCFSAGNRGIAIHTSDRLTSMGQKHIVWRAPESGPVSREVWAPELHFLDDRWHVYFAASDGRNENHLAYVLRSESTDPLGPYELHGPLATGEGADGRSPNIWAIDMTVLEHRGQRYAIWSGWDAPGTDRQFLYIAPMKSPVELAGPRVRLCANDDFAWERTELGEDGRGLNEAPQVLKTTDRTLVVYSCGASWLPTYKLGGLELRGSDPLDPAAWHKFDRPLFESTEETYGVGHSCFVRSIDGREWWHVYHAKRDRRPGWRRAVFVQPMRIDEEGMPRFGRPIAAGVPLERPSGEKLGKLEIPFESSLARGADSERWNYLGHHQMIQWSDDGLHLGTNPSAPINDYRSGEKVLLDGDAPSDVTVAVTIDFRGDMQAGDAGILLRAQQTAVGYDAQQGYFAGLIPQTGLAIFGKTDGRGWTEIARADVQIDPLQPQRLRVDAQRDQFTVFVDDRPVLSARDDTYTRGAVGLRVVDTHAVFRNLRVE